jgi:hypothetical protein
MEMGAAAPNGEDRTVGGYSLQPPERPRSAEPTQAPSGTRSQPEEDAGEWMDTASYEADASEREAKSRNRTSEGSAPSMREQDPGDWMERPDLR